MEPYNFVGSQLSGFSVFPLSQSTTKLGKNFQLIKQNNANFDYASELSLCISLFQLSIDACPFETDFEFFNENRD